MGGGGGGGGLGGRGGGRRGGVGRIKYRGGQWWAGGGGGAGVGGGGVLGWKSRLNQARIPEFILKRRHVLARGLGSRAAPSEGSRGGSPPEAARN